MKNITCIITDYEKNKLWEETKLFAKGQKELECMHLINLYPKRSYQTFRGFGGAITEASAHIYQQMSKPQQQKIQRDLFSQEGLSYEFARMHMNSCDFALGNYAYVTQGDQTLLSFDVSHDEKEILPMLFDAKKYCNKNLEILISPWSPPAYMKTNGQMNHGGALKKEYYELWANYFVKFIEEYKKRGVEITSLTVQNEPMATQNWDSCIYTAAQEAEFAVDYLGPALKKAGLGDILIYVWDHNKELAYERFCEIMSYKNAKEYIAGCAVHWYTGDHFEALSLIKETFPDKDVIFTEGCVEYSRFADTNEVKKAEMYAHDIIGNINHGITLSLDWNLLLDHKGGPNHVGNFCAAPIMCDTTSDTYEKRLSFYYIGQFSRYVKDGAKRIAYTKYDHDIELCAFLNPDSIMSVILLNTSEQEKEITLKEGENGVEIILNPHTITTICYESSFDATTKE